MNQTITANEMLMGLEARSRQEFERIVALRGVDRDLPAFQTV